MIAGLVNMVATLSVLPFVDNFGRKPLLWIGNIGMGICLFFIGIFSDYIDYGYTPALVFILLFLIFFASSSGPLSWVYSGEILTARAMSLCAGMNFFWVTTSLFLFPTMINYWGFSQTFYFYSGICLIAALYYKFDLVETKGKSRTEIKLILSKLR